jgi:hypothetical protein
MSGGRRIGTGAPIALLAALGAASCVSKPNAPVQPRSEPQVIETPPPPEQPPPPQPMSWQDMPLSEGDWSYRAEPSGSSASFGTPGAPSFVLRCERAARRVSLWRRELPSGNTMTVRTTFTARPFPLSVQSEPERFSYASLAATDPFLDGVAFSRGRFAIAVPGLPLLVVPTWPEAARVIEDCRD